MRNKFKKGDKVRFLDDVGEAVVTAVHGLDKVYIEDSHGFEYEIHPDKLILANPSEDLGSKYEEHLPDYKEIIAKNVEPKKLKKATKDFEKKYNEEHQYNSVGVVEVDLHIHELISNERGLDASDKLKLQMDHFERMMNRAERERMPRIVFIHGVGQGILRNEIRKYLKLYYPHVKVMDGSYKEYGYGATEVRF